MKSNHLFWLRVAICVIAIMWAIVEGTKTDHAYNMKKLELECRK